MKLPIGPRDYYEEYPSGDHHPGDIWTDLPVHGALKPSRSTSIVITPACDLLNRKVETLTYLPVVSVRDYLASRSHLQEILKATAGQLEVLHVGRRLDDRLDEALPRKEELRAIQDALAK